LGEQEKEDARPGGTGEVEISVFGPIRLNSQRDLLAAPK